MTDDEEGTLPEPTRAELRILTVRQLLSWIMTHGFCTREEILKNWRFHGVKSEWMLYDLEPVIQSLLRDEHKGLGLVHYQHPEPVASAGGGRDFWIVTGSIEAQQDALERLVKHITTRTLTAVNKAYMDSWLVSGNLSANLQAQALLEFGEQTKNFKERFDLAGREKGEAPIYSTFDIEVMRAKWVNRAEGQLPATAS